MLPSEPVTVTAFSAADAARLTDDELLDEQRSFASARRILDAGAAAVSAEIARRSAREFGYSGLAQSRGARTPEALVQQVTGLSATDARKLVAVGTLVAEPSPWLGAVAAGVSSGELSLDAAAAIKNGLGLPGRISVEELTDAAAQLVEIAPQVTPEKLIALARDARTELDIEGVPVREEERRARRYLRFIPLANGNWKIDGEVDPESMAILGAGIDAITAPRRGGPRFVDSADAPAASRVGAGGAAGADDDRTIPQFMLDALVDIVQFASKADAAKGWKLFGRRGASVRVHVAARDLHSGRGFAHIEGQDAAVSVATAERFACDNGIVPVEFDSDGQVTNVGRDQRLHTARQRIGLAARDGGCSVEHCARPPGWCEAHHIDEWLKDGGETSIERGILLCRFHHMLLHNQHWWIVDKGPGDRTMHSPAGRS